MSEVHEDVMEIIGNSCTIILCQLNTMGVGEGGVVDSSNSETVGQGNSTRLGHVVRISWHANYCKI